MVKRLGSAGMIAGAMVSVLVCYTVSLRVSAERAGVEDLRQQIASDMKDIRALEAELRTRARLPQLQRWNDNVLALSAPTAKQYVDGPVQLASFAPNAPAAPQQPTAQLAVATEPSQMVSPPEARMSARLHTVAYTVPVAPAPQVAAAKVVTAAELVAAVAPKPAKVESKAEAKPTTAAAPKAQPKPAKSEPKPAKPEPKQVKPEPKLAKAESKPTKPEKDAKPLPTVRLAEAKTADPLGDLIGDLDRAAKKERKGLVKVAMQ